MIHLNIQTVTKGYLNRTVGQLATRSKIGRDEIKWQELLSHFRSVQAKHEKARRQALGADSSPHSEFADTERTSDPPGGSGPGTDRVGRSLAAGRAPLRRRVTGELPLNPIAVPTPGRPGALSPLNPKARVGAPVQNGAVPVPSMVQLPKQKRTNSLTRK
jgi:vacuole morphology and inheritance protein 14